MFSPGTVRTWVCLCLFVFLMFLDLAGVDVSMGRVERAINAAFDGPEAELCEKDVAVT